MKAHRLGAAALLGITLLALAVRLWHIELTTFGSDEAVLSHLAEDMVRDGRLPLSGPLSSVGLSTPAHFIYFIAPIVAFSRDPAVISGAIAIFNALGVVITMLLGWRAFGPLAGLIAGLLFAFNPLAVAYSRRIWQPDLLPTIAALLLLALDYAVISRRAWWAAATFPIAAFATLAHSSIAPMVPLLLAPAFVLAKMRRWWPLLVGLGAALLMAAPFVAHEFRIAWKDYPNLRYYSSLTSFVDLEALRWFVAVTTNWTLPNDGVVPSPRRAVPDWLVDFGGALALGLLVAGIAFAIAEIAQRGSKPCRATRIRLVGLLFCAVVPVAFSIRHWQPLFLHYFIAFFPSAYLLMAFAATSLVTALGAAARGVRLVALSAALLVSAIWAGGTIGGTAYQATALGTDACFYASINAMRADAFDFAAIGHATGANAAALELDSGESRALAYLLRGDFPDVYLPHPVTTSQTPDLFGNVGLRRIPPGALLSPPAARGAPVFTASVSPGARFTNGVTVSRIDYSATSTDLQEAYVALAWSVDPAASSLHPVVWRATLRDATGAELQHDSGDSFVPAERRGDSVISLLTIDTRREAIPATRPPGHYELALDLIDSSLEPPSGAPYTDPTGTPHQLLLLPFTMRDFQHCDLPSTIP